MRCSFISSVVGSGSLLTGQSGSPLVESEVDHDSFGLVSSLGVPGPFTFRLQSEKMTISNGSLTPNHQAKLTGRINLTLIYPGSLLVMYDAISELSITDKYVAPTCLSIEKSYQETSPHSFCLQWMPHFS